MHEGREKRAFPFIGLARQVARTETHELVPPVGKPNQLEMRHVDRRQGQPRVGRLHEQGEIAVGGETGKEHEPAGHLVVLLRLGMDDDRLLARLRNEHPIVRTGLRPCIQRHYSGCIVVYL